MVCYIFCSCFFIFIWSFIGFFFFLKSGCQNSYSLGINFDKIIMSFLCFLNLPSHQALKIIARWLTCRKRLLFILGMVNLAWIHFSGLWNLDRLQNKHKRKDPNLSGIPKFCWCSSTKQNFMEYHKVNQRFYCLCD